MLTERYDAGISAELILDLQSDFEISDLSDKDGTDFQVNHEALLSRC